MLLGHVQAALRAGCDAIRAAPFLLMHLAVLGGFFTGTRRVDFGSATSSPPLIGWWFALLPRRARS